MQLAAPNAKSNVSFTEALYYRSMLRRLNINVGQLCIIPSTGGGTVSIPIPEDQFIDHDLNPEEPVNMYCEILNWNQSVYSVALIKRQFQLYGIYTAMRNLLPGWGCQYPDSHLMGLPGVGTAMKRAIENLAWIGGLPEPRPIMPIMGGYSNE